MLRNACLTRRLAVWTLLAVAGCGGGEKDPNTSGSVGPEFHIVHGAPEFNDDEPASEEHPVDGYASAMASNGALLTAGTTKAVYEITTGGPSRLAIVGGGPGLPSETGPIRAMTPYKDGVLVAAERGWFFTAGGALQPSAPSAELAALTITGMTTRIADEDENDEPESHLAIVATEGAYELGEEDTVRWTIEGETGAPTAMLAQRHRIVIAYGRRVYEVVKASGKAFPLQNDVGHVTAIACDSLACGDGSLLYFASDAGLVERAPNGSYTVYTLAPEGEPAVPVEAFALDTTRQRLYALAGSHVLRIRSGERPDAVAQAESPGQPRRMAVDKFGDVWTGARVTLRKLALGTPLSFATDVRPIMHEYCAGCHGDKAQGAPPMALESYDAMVDLIDIVLERVTNGSMPPPGYEKKLPNEKIQILVDWAVTRTR
ncbi:c-type cytochrome [Chondromyces crocatus]|uniref:Cytochrome c domain-containing protein n=1 Tax=Chondromyces crocatus TaxID=52 RepID=A0A0K1EA22_CHOCO|nr:cytochrome c [Chondromyces crocatus]AKT37433.1 uncharacterized protein CMC5_015740 [Chondromyces crocatus]